MKLDFNRWLDYIYLVTGEIPASIALRSKAFYYVGELAGLGPNDMAEAVLVGSFDYRHERGDVTVRFVSEGASS